MRLAGIAFGILLLGCADHKNFPPRGGGGGGQGGNTDAGTTDATDATTDANLTTGRVCVVRDLRQLSVCDATGVADIEITLGSAHATTADDGSFTIDLPAGTGLVWQLVHPDFMTSIQQLGTTFVIPMIRLTDFADLQNDNGVLITEQQSTVVVQVLDGAAPLAGATASSSPAAQFPTRYDGASAIVWDVDATGAFGVAWLPGLTGSTATITVTPPAGAAVDSTVPLQPNTITFATIAP